MNWDVTKEIAFAIFGFLGGFGMFIFGMHTMADGLQKAAGGRMKSLLSLLTKNRFLAITVGALVTAIIQSSSATTVMIVGFVNAGLMNLVQAVGVIMGANIGTTITSWIVSSQEWAAFLKPTEIAPLAIFVGALFMFFSKEEKHKKFGGIAVGFGLIFLGLEGMSGAIKPYRDSQVFKDMFIVLGGNPFFGVLAGFLVTAVIQSSSASVGILQSMALLNLVPWNAAVFIILGQNIGTTVTAMLSSIGTNRTAKRAAIIHLMFNIVGTLIFLVGGIVFFNVINKTIGDQIISATEISVFHTIFNVGSTLLLFPFANLLVKVSERIIQGKDIEPVEEGEITLRHLDERILETPSFAVENAIKEVVRMGEISANNVKLAIETLDTQNVDNVHKVLQVEKEINQLEHLITEYLIKISNTNLTERQYTVVSHLFQTVTDIERVADHAANIVELADDNRINGIRYSESANQELREMSKFCIETLELAIQIRESNEFSAVHKIEEREEYIDTLQDRLRYSHIDRLSKGLCLPKSGISYLDVVGHLERISDHALNIAEYVRDEFVL